MGMKIKASDLVAKFIAEKKVNHIFAISGGASLHLIHSIADQPSLQYICCHHEQSCAMAADAYARVSKNIGVAIATSGPGATNLITGICGCYYDSIPLLAITGQVSTFRMKGNTGVRQIGFQETPIVDICKPIVKYAVQITDKNNIIYELEKAYQIATSGRKGPVLIDIPDNIQREIVDMPQCKRYKNEATSDRVSEFEANLSEIQTMIENSKRPILIVGWGVHLSESESFVRHFSDTFGIPFVTTWAAIGITDNKNPLYVGTFGTHGQRHSNFAVQNADLIISFGTRLDTKATGTPVSSFARAAKIIMVDIDKNEIDKFDHSELKIDLKVNDDLSIIKGLKITRNTTVRPQDFENWLKQINQWAKKFELKDNQARRAEKEYVNPYNFFKILSQLAPKNTNIIFDTGCALAWGMQSFEIKESVRIFHDFNNTAMGWSLPAAIGSYFASPKSNTLCITGDGSFMMSMHELAVIKKHNIPIKIFIVNNSGYSMIQQTQDQWLNADYFASSIEGGLDFPDYEDIANAFNLKYIKIDCNQELNQKIEEIINSSQPTLCNLVVSPKMRVIPQVKAGRPNEDMEPLLTDEEFNNEMIIKSIRQ